MKRIPMIDFEVQLEPNYKFFASLGFFPPKRLINSDLMPVSDELITDHWLLSIAIWQLLSLWSFQGWQSQNSRSPWNRHLNRLYQVIIHVGHVSSGGVRTINVSTNWCSRLDRFMSNIIFGGEIGEMSLWPTHNLGSAWSSTHAVTT